VPCLWFDDRGEEAANFYVETFGACGQAGTLDHIARYGDAMHRPKGSVMTVSFTLAEQDFLALNGGPHFKFSPAISMTVTCVDQAEIDKFWEKLSAGGEKGVCGWLTDKFGLSWQVVPTALRDMVRAGDQAKTDRMMQALMQMTKLDIAALKKAYDAA
jgi:predicted 3-demethylubiquinone-9 3-methyltransferase (glyoxalase superfamily)